MITEFINYREFENLSLDDLFIKLKQNGAPLQRAISLLKLLNFHKESETVLETTRLKLIEAYEDTEGGLKVIDRFFVEVEFWKCLRNRINPVLKSFASSKVKQLSDCLYYYNALGDASKLYMDNPESPYQIMFVVALDTLPSIIKYMTGKKCILPSDYLISDLPREEKSKLHFELSMQFKALLDLEDMWKYFNAEILTSEKIEIVAQNNLCRSIARMKSRVERASYKDWHDYFDKYDIPIGKDLPPKAFIDEFEFLAFLSLERYFFTRELKINDIDILHYIRAFTILRKYSDTSTCLDPSYISKDDFENILMENGIDHSNIQAIIESMVFNEFTTYYLHSPLIKFKNGFVFLNHLTKFINPIQSLLGAVSDLQGKTPGKYDYSLSSRGLKFENHVIGSLKRLKVDAKRLHDKADEEEFECDVAFELNNCIYLIECKTHTIPYDSHAYYNHLEKLDGDLKQFKRIASFYQTTGNELLKSKYGFNIDKKRYVNILLLNVPMPESMQVDGIEILDFSAFGRFLDREAPALSVRGPAGLEKIFSKEHKELYEGAFTSDSLNQFLKLNPTANIDSIEPKTISLSIFGVDIVHKKFEMTPILQFKKT